MAEKKSIGCLGAILIGFLFFGAFGLLMTQLDVPVSDSSLEPKNHLSIPETKAASSPKPATFSPSAESKSEDQKRAEIRNEMEDAYYAAKEAVRQYLKDPSDAKFSSLGINTEAKIVPYGYHQWLCSGYVDAYNSFGGKVRDQWGAVVSKSGSTWNGDYVEIEDSVYGKMPLRIAFPLTPEEIAAAEADQERMKALNDQKKRVGDAAALKYNQDQAAKGDAYGLFRMGERYRDGDGVESNLAKAKQYFEKSAAAGSPDAVLALKKLSASKP